MRAGREVAEHPGAVARHRDLVPCDDGGHLAAPVVPRPVVAVPLPALHHLALAGVRVGAHLQGEQAVGVEHGAGALLPLGVERDVRGDGSREVVGLRQALVGVPAGEGVAELLGLVGFVGRLVLDDGLGEDLRATVRLEGHLVDLLPLGVERDVGGDGRIEVVGLSQALVSVPAVERVVPLGGSHRRPGCLAVGDLLGGHVAAAVGGEGHRPALEERAGQVGDGEGVAPGVVRAVLVPGAVHVRVNGVGDLVTALAQGHLGERGAIDERVVGLCGLSHVPAGEVEGRQGRAAAERVVEVIDIGHVPAEEVEGYEGLAALEHAVEARGRGHVPAREVEGCQGRAALEHVAEVLDCGHVELAEVHARAVGEPEEHPGAVARQRDLVLRDDGLHAGAVHVIPRLGLAVPLPASKHLAVVGVRLGADLQGQQAVGVEHRAGALLPLGVERDVTGDGRAEVVGLREALVGIPAVERVAELLGSIGLRYFLAVGDGLGCERASVGDEGHRVHVDVPLGVERDVGGDRRREVVRVRQGIVGIPASEGVAGLGGRVGLGGSLAVDDGLRLDRASAVGGEGHGVELLPLGMERDVAGHGRREVVCIRQLGVGVPACEHVPDLDGRVGLGCRLAAHYGLWLDRAAAVGVEGHRVARLGGHGAARQDD